MTSTRTWLTSIEARVVIHELGHNFGLHHSRGRVCQGGEVWSTACSIYEYGDAFDIMGNARGSPFNALQMRRMGYLDGDAASGSTRVTSAGNYEIGAYAAQSSAPKGLRIPAGIDPATQLERTLYVTLRQAIGRDSGLIYGAGYDAQRTERGIEVNTGSEADGESYLLDATPLSKSGPSDLGDAAFVVGESFVDTESGVTIAPVEVREGVAIVAVTLSTAPGTSLLPTPSDLPPIAADDAASMGSGSSISILVLANDYDPEGQPLAIVSMTQPKAGGVSTDGTGAVIYRAPRKFSGTDSFTYSVSDGHSTATATVTVSARSTAKPGRAR
jgi:hypothetical protein